jgi:dinuclear metal center YbgI/SA1388 family protein
MKKGCTRRVCTLFLLKMTVKIREIQKWMEARFSPGWAETWDHIGLQLGDPEQPVERIGISLEATPRSVSWAVQEGLQLLICHHPLFFQPIFSLNSEQEPGRTALRMAGEKIALLVAHTNLDSAPDGVSTALAHRLGLMDLRPIEKPIQNSVKLVIFIPLGYEEKIMPVLDAMEAGRIGSYRLCTFKSQGEGTFKAEAGSHPFLGEIGEMERVSEWRLEVLIPRANVLELIEKIRRAHPYEEMAYDIYPVENYPADIGLGRVGHFDPPVSWEVLIQRLKQEVEVPSVRVSGSIVPMIHRVAVCGGSGGGLIPGACATGAQVFICGEIGYHPIVSHQGKSLTLIEIGHYPSEKWVIPALAGRLRRRSQRDGWGIEVLEDIHPGDPYLTYY